MSSEGVIDVTPERFTETGKALDEVNAELRRAMIRAAGIDGAWERFRGAHREVERIMLRGPWPLSVRSMLDGVNMDVRYPAMEGLRMDLFFEDMLGEVVGSEYSPVRIILAKLNPGCKVEPHIDEGAFFNGTARYHIPVQTNPEARLWVEGKDYQLMEGRVYRIRNDLMHWATNDGSTPRIHLIFDVLKEE